MDDLYLALFRRGASLNLERQARALASEQPLRALWEFSSEPAGAALTTEFLALANRRPAIRAEISAYAEQFRSQQAERSEEHTSELQSLMRTSYAVFCLKNKTDNNSYVP